MRTDTIPTPREPECSINHTFWLSSKHTSMKWLPVPNVPKCLWLLVFFKHLCLAQIASNSGNNSAHSLSTWVDVFSQEPLSRPPRNRDKPCGTALSIADRQPCRLSGKSFAVRVVRAAIIPQPMSTPTAAGIIAPIVGITLPMVEPLPRCTSGITATCL